MIRQAPRAFSLVEIVMAMGVISFCLLAIVGLLSVGHMASREATDDTSLAAAASQLIGKIRAEPEMVVDLLAQPDRTLPGPLYFDSQGLAVSDETESLYSCKVTAEPVTDTEVASVSPVLIRVRMEFSWPPQAKQPSRRVFCSMHAVAFPVNQL